MHEISRSWAGQAGVDEALTDLAWGIQAAGSIAYQEVKMADIAGAE
jgi:hypothetical protein